MDFDSVPTRKVTDDTGICENAVNHIRLLKQMRRTGKINTALEEGYPGGKLDPIYYVTPEDYYIQVEEKLELLKRIDLLRAGMYHG